MLIDLLLFIVLALAVVWGLCFLLMPLHLAKLWQDRQADAPSAPEQDEHEAPLAAPRATKPARDHRPTGQKPLYLKRPRDPRSLPLP